MRIRLFTIALIAFVATCAHAGSTSCSTATSLVPDGRLLDFDNVPPSTSTPTSNWYQFTAIAGRSYSVEVRDDLDPNNGDFTVTYYGPNSTCTNLVTIPTTIATVTDTHSSEPVLMAGARSSIVTCPTANFTGSCSASGAGTYLIKVQNTNTIASRYVSVSLTETTLYAINWSTYGPASGQLNASFQMLNTTSQSISYTLTAVATNITPPGPVQTYTVTSTLGAVGTSSSTINISTSSGAGAGYLNIPASQAGYAILTHSGPPAAIQPFGLVVNYTTTPLTLVPIPFGPMRGK